MNKTKAELEKELIYLTSELEEKKASLPAHSIRPAQLIAIEELEDAIEVLKQKLKEAV